MGEQVRYRVADEVPFRVLPAASGQEAVIVHPVENRVLGLNRSGTEAWKALAQGAATLDELTDAIWDRFDVDRATLRADLAVFLEEMTRRGLLLRESGEQQG